MSFLSVVRWFFKPTSTQARPENLEQTWHEIDWTKVSYDDLKLELEDAIRWLSGTPRIADLFDGLNIAVQGNDLYSHSWRTTFESLFGDHLPERLSHFLTQGRLGKHSLEGGWCPRCRLVYDYDKEKFE